MQSASYFKLKNLTIGYQLALPKTFPVGVRLYATATNLFTLTPYKGYDPEVSGEDILRLCTDNIIACSKPHIANHPIHREVFDEPGYAIVSCYNNNSDIGYFSTTSTHGGKRFVTRSI